MSSSLQLSKAARRWPGPWQHGPFGIIKDLLRPNGQWCVSWLRFVLGRPARGPTTAGPSRGSPRRASGPVRRVGPVKPICFSPYLYRARNLAERFFNRIKQCRRVGTRYDKLAANYLAFIKLAAIRFWLRAYKYHPSSCRAALASRFAILCNDQSQVRRSRVAVSL